MKENAAKKSSNNNNEDEEVPQVVFERMMARILASVGVPMATGLALLHLFGVAKERNLWDVPLWLPFLATNSSYGL
ncbi:protein PAM68, chloroplastic [Gossypium australe]|uniref:Protein PAM68, chloroplastic n=1 Tax=Gossypium australe TaxID=47621 RepID=A0A5B6W486_9ROSI|nr:protein PAM68, chloroplastic [Gossypium australe]